MRTRVSTAIQLIFLVGFSAIGSATANAQGYEPESGGLYAGAGVNGSFENFDENLIDFDDAVGFGVRGGYRFQEWFAVELQYEWSGTFDGDVISSEIDLYYLGVNAKVYPLKTWIDPYLLLGVGLAYGHLDTPFGDADESAAALRFGMGVEVPVYDALRLSVDAGYVQPTGNLDDFAYATMGVGFIWYFGDP
jgi:opacity protein-like surface antigen